MSFTQDQIAVLEDIGQLAADLPCCHENMHEFISIFVVKKHESATFELSFPYYREFSQVYRVVRFRVRSHFVEDDIHVGPDDLLGIQSIYVPSLEDVEIILRLWKLSPDILTRPADTNIPI